MRVTGAGLFLITLFLGGGIAFWIVMPDIYIGQIWVAVSLILILAAVLGGKQAKRADALRRDGITGEGRILEATQTGAQVNEQPRVRLRLAITAPGVQPFEVDDTHTVPLIALGTLTGGDPLVVHLDPEDHAKYIIDWGARPAGRTSRPSADTVVRERLAELDALRRAGTITEAEHAQQRERVLASI